MSAAPPREPAARAPASGSGSAAGTRGDPHGKGWNVPARSGLRKPGPAAPPGGETVRSSSLRLRNPADAGGSGPLETAGQGGRMPGQGRGPRASLPQGEGKGRPLLGPDGPGAHAGPRAAGAEGEGGGTYAAHEVQEGGGDGRVGLHGVMHDQDGRLCGRTTGGPLQSLLQPQSPLADADQRPWTLAPLSAPHSHWADPQVDNSPKSW